MRAYDMIEGFLMSIMFDHHPSNQYQLLKAALAVCKDEELFEDCDIEACLRRFIPIFNKKWDIC